MLATLDGLLNNPLSGIIRPENIMQKDVSAETVKSFRVNDLILAKVMSYGDRSCYVLNTLGNQYGVISAVSESNHQMIPISWTEMVCPITMKKEYRKVAKVQQNLQEIVSCLI